MTTPEAIYKGLGGIAWAIIIAALIRAMFNK